MSIIDEIKNIASEKGAELSEKKGLHSFRVLIAERKAFLANKKLEYIAMFRIIEESKELKFTELLKEKSSGFSTGGSEDISQGFGFKKMSHSSGINGRSGGIQEQSNLFGKKYSYKFDYGEIRKEIESIALKEGYNFKYQITPIGL